MSRRAASERLRAALAAAEAAVVAAEASAAAAERAARAYAEVASKRRGGGVVTHHERRLHRVAGLLCSVACDTTEGLSRRLDAYATGLCAARRLVAFGHDSIALELTIRRVRRLRDMAEMTAIRRIGRAA